MSKSSHGAVEPTPARFVSVSREHVWLSSNEPDHSKYPAGSGVLWTIPFPVWLSLIWLSWFSLFGPTACGSIKHHAAQWVWIWGQQSAVWSSEQSRENSDLRVSSAHSLHCPPKPSDLDRFFLVHQVFRLPCNAKEFQDNAETCKELAAKGADDSFWKEVSSVNTQNLPEKYMFSLT